jgi:hypothetical protein
MKQNAQWNLSSILVLHCLNLCLKFMNSLILKELRGNKIIFVLCHVVLRNNLFFLPTQLRCMWNYTQRISLHLQRVSSRGQFKVYCVQNYKNYLWQVVCLFRGWLYCMRLRMRSSEFQTVLISWPTWFSHTTIHFVNIC